MPLVAASGGRAEDVGTAGVIWDFEFRVRLSHYGLFEGANAGPKTPKKAYGNMNDGVWEKLSPSRGTIGIVIG